MSDKSISDLRDHLFATIVALRDPVNPMDVNRARAISEVARQIVDSAKVEVEHMKVAGGDGSGFIPRAPALPSPSAKDGEQPAANGIVGITQHFIKG